MRSRCFVAVVFTVAACLLVSQGYAQFRLPSFRGGQRVTPTPVPQLTPYPEASSPAPSRRTTADKPKTTEAKPKATPRPKPKTNDGDKPKSAEKKESTAKKAAESEARESEAKSEAKAADEEKAAEAKASDVEKDARRAEAVVRDFLNNAHAMRYSAAKSNLTPQLIEYFNSSACVPYGDIKAVLDAITHNSDLTSVTYANHMLVPGGEGAQIEAEMDYNTGANEKRVFDLIKVQGNWKLSLRPEMLKVSPVPVSVGAPRPPAPPAPVVVTPVPTAKPAQSAQPTPEPAGDTAALATPVPPSMPAGKQGAAAASTGGALDSAPWAQDPR